MAFALMDDQIHGHPKFARAGLDAIGLWALCLSYCSDYLTDGHIPREVGERFAGRSLHRLAAKLVNCGGPGKPGLWDVVDGGWQMHDYLDWNPSAATVKEKRETERQRKASGRKSQGRDDSGRITSARNPAGQTTDGAVGHTGSHAHAHSGEEKINIPAGARVMGTVEDGKQQMALLAAWEEADLPGSPGMWALAAELRNLPEAQRMTPGEVMSAYKRLLAKFVRGGLTMRVTVENLIKNLSLLVQIHRGELVPEQSDRLPARATARDDNRPVIVSLAPGERLPYKDGG